METQGTKQKCVRVIFSFTMIYKLADTLVQSVWEGSFNFCVEDYWSLGTTLVTQHVPYSSDEDYCNHREVEALVQHSNPCSVALNLVIMILYTCEPIYDCSIGISAAKVELRTAVVDWIENFD